jgi:glycine dehydrogenase subunit 2
MYMLHRTFGAPKAGGGPAVGAYGCSAELAPFVPGPVVTEDGGSFRLDHDRPQGAGKVREHWGNVPQLVYAYTWSRAMGAEGIREPSGRLGTAQQLHGEAPARAPQRDEVASSPHGPADGDDAHGLETLEQETGVTVIDVQNRLVDFGIDAFWLSHEPWIVPQPFTPDAGERDGCRSAGT